MATLAELRESADRLLDGPGPGWVNIRGTAELLRQLIVNLYERERAMPDLNNPMNSNPSPFPEFEKVDHPSLTDSEKLKLLGKVIDVDAVIRVIMGREQVSEKSDAVAQGATRVTVARLVQQSMGPYAGNKSASEIVDVLNYLAAISARSSAESDN